MFYAAMRAAIGEARTLARMDDLSRAVWQAAASAAVSEEQAQDLAEFLEAARAVVRDRIVPVGIPLGRPSLFPPRRIPRSPDRAASRERRRLLASSGPLPPQIACRFTEGQRAVLKVVADEVARTGLCGLCIDAIAARAGVCRRLAQGALRLAAGDGLLTIEERRHQGRKNDPNLVRVLSREWLAWIRRRTPRPAASPLPPLSSASTGCKALHPADRGDLQITIRARGKRRNAAERQRPPSTDARTRDS